MAICECGREMHTAEGCRYSHMKFTPTYIKYNTKNFSNEEGYNDFIRSSTLILPRTKVGAINDMFTADDYKEMGRERCPDCAAKVGHYHHINCDNERCPRCGLQLLCCDCGDDFEMEFIEYNEPDNHECYDQMILYASKIKDLPDVRYSLKEFISPNIGGVKSKTEKLDYDTEVDLTRLPYKEITANRSSLVNDIQSILNKPSDT